MDWKPLLEAIRLAVARAARLPDLTTGATGRPVQRVTWRGTRAGSRTGRGPWVDLRRTTTKTIGRDETRYDYLPAGHDPLNPADDALVPVVMGNRQFRVQVYCTSLSAEPGEDAEWVAQTIRDRWLLPSVTQPLRDVQVGFVRMDASISYHWIDSDKREVSEVVFDIVLSVAIAEREDVAPAGGWVETAEAVGALDEGRDGQPVLPFAFATVAEPPAAPDTILDDQGRPVVEDDLDPIVRG